MADNETPTVTIGLDLESAALLRELKALQEKVGKQTKDIGKKTVVETESTFSKSISSLVGKLAAFGAVAVATFSLKKLVGAAIESEDALNRFNTALALSGEYSQQTSDKFQKLAANLQNKSIFDDEAILNSAAKIQTLGQLSAPALERATKASVELASALRIDLGTASNLVAKASQGHTETLGKYGIVLDETKNKAEKFEQVLKLIESKFGGSAEAQTKTFSGAIKQLENNFGNLLEKLGEGVTQSPKLIAAFGGVSDYIVTLTKDLPKALGFSTFISDATSEIVVLANQLKILLYPLEVVFNFSKVVFLSLNTLVNGLISRFYRLGAAAGSMLSYFTGDNSVTNALQAFSDQSYLIYTSSFQQTADAVKNIFDTSISSSVSSGLSNIKSKVDNAKPFDGLKNNLKNNTDEMAKTLQEVSKKINTIINITFKEILERGMENLGYQLGRGKFAFGEFAAVVLNIIGDMAIQIGSAILGIGLGLDMLKTGLLTLQGAGAIAAGLALILTGGVIKGVASSLKEGAQPSGQPTAMAVSTAAPSQPENIQQPEMKKDEEPKTQIIVNGSYFDTDEAGSRMVNLINGANSRTGSRIRREAIA
jgi:hypothetical protein